MIEVRLREAINETELKRLQLLYDKATDELNSTNEQVGDPKKEARIPEARIQTLKNEGDRAKAGEA